MGAPLRLSEASAILGIESSCDETAAAVVRGADRIESSIVASQDDLHAPFGGVVPEVASRKHAELLTAVVQRALTDADVGWDGLSAIAVTHGPGLVGSLIVGVAAAKAYSLAARLPLVGVNHIEAHVHAAFLREGDAASPAAEAGLDFPLVCLVASGGHCDLLHVPRPGQYRLLGCARDDAPGEAFDKAARLLGLGYPGGPAIEAAAARGNTGAVELPRPKVGDTLDFSFSGLKTALVRLVEARHIGVPDVAAGFQAALVETLVRNTIQATERTRAKGLILSGGVAANSELRASMASAARSQGVPFAVAAKGLCTDNAAMVAAAGFHVLGRRGPDDLCLDVFSTLPLAEAVQP